MSKAEQEHLSRVTAMGCIICGQAAEAHHIRDGQGMGKKASHFEVIPLCHRHHRTGGHGVAFHAGKRTWQELYGNQRDLLKQVMERLEMP